MATEDSYHLLLTGDTVTACTQATADEKCKLEGTYFYMVVRPGSKAGEYSSNVKVHVEADGKTYMQVDNLGEQNINLGGMFPRAKVLAFCKSEKIVVPDEVFGATEEDKCYNYFAISVLYMWALYKAHLNKEFQETFFPMMNKIDNYGKVDKNTADKDFFTQSGVETFMFLLSPYNQLGTWTDPVALLTANMIGNFGKYATLWKGVFPVGAPLNLSRHIPWYLQTFNFLTTASFMRLQGMFPEHDQKEEDETASDVMKPKGSYYGWWGGNCGWGGYSCYPYYRNWWPYYYRWGYPSWGSYYRRPYYYGGSRRWGGGGRRYYGGGRRRRGDGAYDETGAVDQTGGCNVDDSRTAISDEEYRELSRFPWYSGWGNAVIPYYQTNTDGTIKDTNPVPAFLYYKTVKGLSDRCYVRCEQFQSHVRQWNSYLRNLERRVRRLESRSGFNPRGDEKEADEITFDDYNAMIATVGSTSGTGSMSDEAIMAAMAAYMQELERTGVASSTASSGSTPSTASSGSSSSTAGAAGSGAGSSWSGAGAVDLTGAKIRACRANNGPMINPQYADYFREHDSDTSSRPAPGPGPRPTPVPIEPCCEVLNRRVEALEAENKKMKAQLGLLMRSLGLVASESK